MKDRPRYGSDFLSQGTRCEGWLFLPEGVERPPVVVMAHGFAAEKTFGMTPFARAFLERGLATFLFDYRNFGGSDGEPRNLVQPWRHLADWRAALRHVRSLEQVDGSRVGLWGSSFSGGHVAVVAAGDPGVRAIVCQVPFSDGLAVALSMPPRFLAKATAHALRDLVNLARRRPPHCVPVVSEPDEFAAMNTAESFPGYMAIVPDDSDWNNACPARILLYLLAYRPTMFASRVRCPALVILGERDSLIPASSVARMACKMPKARLERLDCGHFDVYSGPTFERVSAIEAEFLADRLS